MTRTGPVPASKSLRDDKSSFLSQFTNRQQYSRCSVFVPSKVTWGDQTIDSNILNISLGGAWLRLPSDIEVGSPLTISPKGYSSLECEIVRQNGVNLGVAFTGSVIKNAKIVHEILGSETVGTDGRMFPRRTVLFSGKNYSGIKAIKCRVCDISLGGARVNLEKNFSVENSSILRIDQYGEFKCEMIWQYESMLGLAFVDSPRIIVDRLGSILPSW